MTTYQTILEESENSPQSQEVLNKLREFNDSNAGPSQRKGLNLYLRNENGHLKAGLLGYTHWDWLFVSILWVDDSLRGQGHGARLLRKAEEVAAKRGCNYVHLDTFSFQAPDFYPKMGYTIFGKLENCPLAKMHRNFLYKKLSKEP